MTPVTDPALLAQLDAPSDAGQPVTDPALLRQLNGEPEPAPKPQAEMRAYNPTLRDKFANGVDYVLAHALGESPDARPSGLRDRLVTAIAGSRGLGETGVGAVDLTPAGIPMAVQEGQQEFDKGNYGTAVLKALSVIPAVGPLTKAAAPATKAAAPKVSEQIAQAAAQEGITIPKAAATDSVALKQIGGAVKELPFIGSPLVQASRESLDQIAARTGAVADAFSTNTASAGYSARDAARGWIEGTSRDIADRVFSNIESAIKPGALAPLSRTRAAATQLTAEQIESTGRAAGSTIERVREALQRPQGLTFNGIKNLRSEIGDLINKSGTDTNLSQGALKRIYAGLTEDMRFAVSRAKNQGGGGGAGLAAFEKANRIYEAVKARQKTLTDIIGRNMDAPEGTVVERIRTLAGSRGGADVRKLMDARKAIGPEAWDDVAANIITDLGRTKDGFSIAQFRTGYEKLSEEGRNALFASTGKGHLKESLDNISIIGQGAEQLMRLGNPSGSGRLGAIVAGGAGIGAGIFSPPVLLGMLAGAGQGWVVAKLLSRPVTAKALANAGAAALQAAQTGAPAALQNAQILAAHLARLAAQEGIDVSEGGQAAGEGR